MPDIFSLKGKKFTWKSVVFLVALMSILIIIQNRYKKQGDELSIERSMNKTANEINKTCPHLIDSVTRLDNVSAFPNRVLQYHYTILNIDTENIDTVSLQNEVKLKLKDRLRSDPKYKTSNQRLITMSMKYFDQAGKYLFTALITPSDVKD